MHPVGEIVANSTTLVSAFRALGSPVIFASVTGTPSGRTQYGSGSREFPPEFRQLAPELVAATDDLVITRSTWSAFAGTGLYAHLSASGVTQVVLVGVATSFGVESTARDAYDLGFNVLIVSDAITDRSLDAHNASFQRVFPALGEVATTSEIGAILASA